ncbi:uncharacterized protein C2orf42 homolog isoform X2 [Rhodnius prolixus]|uniref:uncharacterized protein C2orf42 homolog isoform X2 n=1 Tax=Rhodnius prolixus TaxID=13249 RepID=UPI003D18AA1E
MLNEDRLRAMLSDLGRSTLRGIRKCPKCGTYNGIRGLSCKNKACDMVFKEAGEKRKQSMEVAKLDTGLSTQIFSVRVRDKGPDYRGFVQLPAVQPSLGENETAYLLQMSVCFVESCQRLFNTNILKCHERQAMSVTTCQHIQSAMRCCADAQVLPIDSDVLKSLSISNQMKEAIWQLALETPGPLVQRVSKSIMAVKCKVTTKHPLGFLHVSFFPSTKLKENNFSCACTPKNQSKSPNESIRNCVHYYSCIVAFASNDKCLEEFGSFIMKERAPESFTLDLNSSAEEEQNHFVAILESEIGHDSVESVLPKDMMLPDISQDFDRLTTVVEDITHELETGLDHQALESVIIKADEIPLKQEELSKSQKRKRGTTNKQGDSGKKFLKKDLRKQLHISDEAVDESKVQMTFIEWLASVTERINQTMHFQFDGKPEPLVFHAPHAFFDCFLERLMAPSVIVRRKRLPNLVTTFTRKNAPPLGTFYNYTWHISNILHAKAIFDTPLMLLNVKRGFILKADGTYDDIEPCDIQEGVAKREGEATIRPVDFKTYLKIGKTKPDQDVPSVLSIDWTPNVLPISKIGELKITFEYGHSPEYV